MTAADASPEVLPVPAPPPVGRRTWAALWPWVAAPISGVLLVLCLAPWEQEWLCWLALTPLIAAAWFAPAAAPAKNDPGNSRLARARKRLGRWWRRPALRLFALGYLCGLVYIWAAFYWLTTVTVPGWIILGPYMAVYPALWTVIVGTIASPGRPLPPTAPLPRTTGRVFIWNPPPASGSRLLRSRWNLWFAFVAATSWVTLEWVRSWMFSGWGWNDLGIALHANLPFLQIVEYTGVGGLSFLAAFVNVIAVATVGRFVLEVRSHRVRPHFDFTLTVAALMVIFAAGIRTLRHSDAERTRPGVNTPLRVAAIQAGIAQAEKWDPALADGIITTYDELTTTALATRPQLLIWPEAATPYGMFDSRGQTLQTTFRVVQTGKCNLLFGTLDYDFGPDGRSQADYNAAMLVEPRDQRVQTYRKIHLVPFGEYVPYRHEFPLFAWIVGDQVPEDFAFGKESTVFETVDPAVRVAPLICFEDSIGELVRRPVLAGAQLLVNVTNDAWFQRTAASRQHLNEAVFRTVENRRPLVRCANTGVTCFIDRDGRIAPQSLLLPDGRTPFGQGILAGVVDVPNDPATTYYTRHGDVFSEGCAASVVVVIFFAVWARLRRVTVRTRAGQPTHGSPEIVS